MSSGRQKLVVAGASVAVLAVVAVLGSLAGWVTNPFASSRDVEVDTAAALIELRDLADYHAASGTFEVVVSASQDADYLPDVVKGRNTTMRVAGTVDAVVDLSELAAGALVLEGEDERSVRVTLPAVELTAPVIDRDRSEVVERQRGIFDRIGDAFAGDPAGDEALVRLGAEEISRLAVQTELRERAETNTRNLLEAMLTRLGFERVVVEFAAPEL